MHAPARPPYQPKTAPISAAIGDAGIGPAGSYLLLGLGYGLGPGAIQFIFPTDNAGWRKPTAQLGNDLHRGCQLGHQRIDAGGNFSRLNLLQFTRSQPAPNFSKSEIADRSGMKKRLG